MLWAFAAPGFYLMAKGILSSFSLLFGDKPSKIANFFSRWGEDMRLMVKSILALGAGLLLLQFGTNFFLDQGKEHGEKYLLKPRVIRYTEKSAPSKEQEATILFYNAGRYFLKPKTMNPDVSFIIVGESELSAMKILK